MSSEAGTWMSTNPSIAEVNNAGLVTALSPGQAAFVFTSLATGCSSLATRVILVNATPTAVINGSTSICIGNTTSLFPSFGGNWISSNPLVASVSNTGLVTAISTGQATFTYTESSSGCISQPTAPIIVYDKPAVSISGPSFICIGGTTTLSPSTGGIWQSSNSAVAIVSNGGIVTGLSAGTATFFYAESGSGCISEFTAAVTVGGKPPVAVSGPSAICIGSTTNLSPSSGGVWV